MHDTLRLLGLDQNLVRLMMTVEEHPRSKADLLGRGFSRRQVDGLLNRRLARVNRLGRIQLGMVGEALLDVVFTSKRP